MQITAELIEAGLTAIGGFFAGGGLSFAFWKRKAGQFAGQAANNLTPGELLSIVFQINKAISLNSPAGEEISPGEAEALGRAVWQALKE